MNFAPRVVLSLAIALALLGHAGAASAQASETRAKTETIARQLEADPELRAITQSLVGRARKALVRANHARSSGDQQHGAELEALALELATSGLDLARAVRAESDVAKLAQRALDAETRVVRARALVEQTAARRGRAAAQLRAAEQAANEKKAKP